MKSDRANSTVMGFARYKLNEGVTTDQLIERSWKWRRDFLSTQGGIVGHWLLGNVGGEFADAILAEDEDAFDAMSAVHSDAESSRAVLELIDPDTIRLRKNNILKSSIETPSGFACIEYGTFKPKQDALFSEQALLAASKKIEDEYLIESNNTIEHFVARVDDDTYSEVVFGRTLGQTRRTCYGYIEHSAGQKLLSLFDPESVDLDFWYVLD